MPLSIGVNLRVTGHCNQGGRKYMEDMFSVAFQSTPDDKDLEYAFFGIFDGHGGGEAASYAKEHLMNVIVKQKNFWSDRDEDVLRAIRDGYVSTHYAMWRELDKWPRTASGLPSTAGTTASIAFIRKGKIYIGHVGDSAIILGYQVDGDPQWRAKALTKDHKPESGPEMMRIRESGGKVVSKSGVPRVVWNRPRIGHKGPVRRSTHIDEIPFLAVARSLGDLWSYNSELNTFVVSPEPDVKVVAIDVESHRCLIFGTDGLWNMLTPQGAVAIVQAADRHNEKHLIASQQTCNGQQSDNVQLWINPSKSLVDKALERWSQKRLRADNTSVVTLMLDPPGPSRSEVLLSQKECVMAHHSVHSPATTLSTENLEKPTYSSMSLSVPRPPPTPSHINLQKPELCNRIEDTREEATSEKILPEEKLEDSLDISHQIGDEVRHTNIEDVNGADKIAETISHEIAEKNLDGGDNELETSPPKKTDQEQSVANEKQPEVVEDQVDQVVPNSESPTTESTESKAAGDSNVIHQSAFFCEGHDVCSPMNVDGAAEKGSVSSERPAANENKVAGNVLNGSHPKQQTLFSSLRKETRYMRRKKHSLNGHSRNSLTEAASAEKSSVSLESPEANENKVAGNVLNGSRPKQQTLFSSLRKETRYLRRKKHSLNGHSRNSLTEAASAEPTTKTYVNPSWFKPPSTKVAGNTVDEVVMNSSAKTAGNAVGTKRRHSAISQSVVGTVEETCVLQEPCFKRRTRSEDRPNPVDENDPANQTTKEAASSLSWPGTESNISRSPGNAATIPIQDRLSPLNTFQRNLGKKVTPVKAIRRPSIKGLLKQLLAASLGGREWDNRSNGCIERRISRTMSIIGSSDSTTVPQRWLRSDTIAATPVKTLRSRNVDMHQYSLVKQPNRLSLSSKLKQSSNNGFLQSGRVRSASLPSGIKQTNNNTGSGTCSTISPTNTGCNTSSGMAKRVKSPYNPSARSLSTRSRIKRLGK